MEIIIYLYIYNIFALAALVANAATAPPAGDMEVCRPDQIKPPFFFSFPSDNVEPELLHTYSRIDPYDTLILCVRVAVLTAVTLTVPIVLFPVSARRPQRQTPCGVSVSLTDDLLCGCRYGGPSCRCSSPPRPSTGCVTSPSHSLCSPSSTCW